MAFFLKIFLPRAVGSAALVDASPEGAGATLKPPGGVHIRGIIFAGFVFWSYNTVRMPVLYLALRNPTQRRRRGRLAGGARRGVGGPGGRHRPL